MPEDKEDQGEREEDELEPLDKFFAPIEDVDWPEEQGQGKEGEPSEPSTPAPEAQEDLLPRGLSDDPLAGVEDEIGSETSDRTSEAPEQTAEMTGPGWEELRLDVGQQEPDVTGPAGAGEEEEPAWEREPGFGEPVTEWRDEALAGLPEAGATYPEPEDEGELTLEDLKSPPPEYVHLPGPPGEEEGAPGEEVEPVEPAVPGIEEGALAGEPPISEEVSPATVEAELEAAEAAADHFAESLREGPESEAQPEPVPPADLTGRGSLPTPEEVEEHLLADLDSEPVPPPPVRVGATDTLGGPSWQEPTSEEVTSAPSRPPGGRNLQLAFLSGIVLVAIGIGAIAWGKAPFTVVAGAVIVLAQGELYAALHRRGYQPATALGLVFGGLISAAAYLRGERGALAIFALGSILTFLWFIATPAKARVNAVANIAMTILPLGYVAFLGSYVMVILALPGGRTLMLSVVGLAVGYDIAAYAIGSLWGSRPLAPTISPRKSWEGAIGATLILLLVSVALLASLDAIGTVGRAIGLALVVSVAAPLGDLAESMLKRDLGVKDMGSLIPGHGGILDRIDSILFAAPAAFYFFRLVLS